MERLRFFPVPAWRTAAGLLAAFACLTAARAGAAELKVSRAALQKTLVNQLFTGQFGGQAGRYYLKGAPGGGCSVYAENPRVSFTGDRIVVDVKTHATIGTAVKGKCIGISLSPESEVSMAPQGEGETIGFRDARVERVSDQKELNFLLMPFLSRKIPGSMTVNAADLLRKALAGSTASSGYKVSLERLKIHSVEIEGDNLVVDMDGDLKIE